MKKYLDFLWDFPVLTGGIIGVTIALGLLILL